MKKIMFLFLTVLTLVMFSCETQERIKNVTINPPQMMSMFKVTPAGSQITSTDTVSISVPNVADVTIYYEIAVGDCKEPTTASTKFAGDFPLSTKNLSAKNGDMITLKILAEKEGYESATATKKWFYSDGSAPVLDNDAFLKSVTISGMSFSLLPGVFVYNDISVPNDVDKVTIDYEKSNYAATVETTPASLNDIPLTEKQTTLVALRVTSADKSTTKRYLFNIYRAGIGDDPIKSTNCYLSSLSVDGAKTAIIFDKNTTNYDVTLLDTTEKTKIVYQTEDSKATAILNGGAAEFSIAKGETVIRKIIVTAEAGNTKEYTVSVYRPDFDNPVSSDATLKSLSVSGVDLTFNSATTEYSVTIPAEYTSTVSVTYEKNHSGATVISDPVNLDNITVFPAVVKINVTAEDKVTTKLYTININKTVGPVLSKNANLSSITLSAGSLTPAFNTDTLKYSVSVENAISSVSVTATPEDAKADVTITPSGDTLLEENKAKDFTISVTAEDGTGKDYVVSVTRQPKRNDDDFGTIETEYYWTNKNGAVGTNKTISSFSDWTEAEKIVQCAANDDPRAFRGYHEKAVDFYALYAAYDDTNLYLMVEMPSIDGRDITSKDWQYALDENLGMGVGINTGKGPVGDGEMDAGNTPWNAAGKFYSIKPGIDTLLMFHPSEYGTPGYFITKSDGKFSYDKEYCLTWKDKGASTDKKVGLVSTTLYGRSDNYGLTETEYLGKSDYVDMLKDPEKSGVTGYMYQITISLAGLGIDKAYIESTGISVMTFSTFGTSMMDALPWDSSLIDVAAEAYVADASTSHEKEDIDEYDVRLARVGHM
ncbi:MAG: cadherin-like beta sandwich domain-containing protein [Spirochaetales bacterium]|nr:cadherin-like beta sandwich domain-containing protein [Spirochaetales bacterium]